MADFISASDTGLFGFVTMPFNSEIFFFTGIKVTVPFTSVRKCILSPGRKFNSLRMPLGMVIRPWLVILATGIGAPIRDAIRHISFG